MASEAKTLKPGEFYFMTFNEQVCIAVGGTVERFDRCPSCQQGMLYRTKAQNMPGRAAFAMLVAKFCENPQCPRWLQDEPITDGTGVA